MIESPIVLIVVGCAILALLYFFSFVRLVSGKDKIEQKLKGALIGMEERIQDYERRLGLLEVHALDYLNSLGADGTKQLKELRVLLEGAHQLTDEIGSLIATHDYDAFEDAKILLTGIEVTPEQDLKGYAKPIAGNVRVRADWEARFEELIQSVGQTISVASHMSHAQGMPSRRRDKPTVAGLLEAGVKALTHELRMKQSPVRTALTKNNRTIQQ